MMDSIARQRAAVEKQASSSSFFTLPFSGPPLLPPPPPQTYTAPECDPMPEGELARLITAAATAHQVKPEVVRAVIRQESASRPCAVSAKGAMGLMQVMPETANQFQLADPFDPAQNVQTGTRYLKQLLDRFNGDLKLALAAYNAGPSRITGNAVPDIPETRTYVQQILSELERPKP